MCNLKIFFPHWTVEQIFMRLQKTFPREKYYLTNKGQAPALKPGENRMFNEKAGRTVL